MLEITLIGFSIFVVALAAFVGMHFSEKEDEDNERW